MADYSKIISQNLQEFYKGSPISCPFSTKQENIFLGFFVCKNICSPTTKIYSRKLKNICKLGNSCPCVMYSFMFGKARALNYALYPPVQLGD